MKISKESAREWLWFAVAVAVALQIYFVRELIAAEILFLALFGVGLVLGFVFYLVDQITERSVAWAESGATALADFARHRAGQLGDLTKKSFRRAGSEPAS